MANENQRVIKTGLDKKYVDMLNAVVGQMSDGYWENTPRMKGYWLFAGAEAQGNEAVLVIDKDYAERQTRNLFLDMTDDKVKQFFADKIKFLVKAEGLKWDRGNTEETDYLSYSDPYTVKDCYFAYETLKNRNTAKHPEYSEGMTRKEFERQWMQNYEQQSVACQKANQDHLNVLREADKQIQAAGYTRLGAYSTANAAHPEDADGTYVNDISDWLGYDEPSYFGYTYGIDSGSDVDYEHLSKLALDNGLSIVDADDDTVTVGYTIEVPEAEDLEDAFSDYQNYLRGDGRFESFYATKDGKDYQVGIELEEGDVNAPKKCTVTVNGEKETVDVSGKAEKEDIEKAIKKGIEKMGYKVNEERMSFEKLKADALERLGEGATYADEEDLEDSIVATLDAMPYDIPEGTKEALATELFDELVDTIGESKKSESSEGWEGWEEVEGLELTIEQIEQLAYELRVAVRGGYTGCKTWAELSEYVKGLGKDLIEAGRNIAYAPEEDDED